MRDLRVGMVTGYLHPLSHRSMKQKCPALVGYRGYATYPLAAAFARGV